MKKRDKRVSFTPNRELDIGIREFIRVTADATGLTVSRSVALAALAERGLKSWRRKREAGKPVESMQNVTSKPPLLNDPMLEMIEAPRNPWKPPGRPELGGTDETIYEEALDASRAERQFKPKIIKPNGPL
jgi:hypothetical protein